MNIKEAKASLAAIRVKFPGAESVFAMGSFNNWSTTATLLRAVGDGLWEFKLPSDVNLKELCYFVWLKGENFGHIQDYKTCEPV